jgi:Domain of unknown function (DUF6430)
MILGFKNGLAIKRFVKNLIYILGFFATIMGFYLAIYNPLTNSSISTKLISLTIFMIINIGISVILSLPKSRINLQITNKVNLNVYYGDIFNQKGVVVIPVNEYFDTLVDDKIISSSTLHGQFIKQVFGGNIAELDRIIKKELQNYKEKAIVTRSGGNSKKYELGTTISIDKDGKCYYLVAFTRFNEKNKAESFNVDYQIILKSLLDFIHVNSQGKNVNIPLIGGGQSGINLTKQKLLEYLLFSIQIHDHLTVSGNINIVLNNDLKNGEIDLNNIKELFSGL